VKLQRWNQVVEAPKNAAAPFISTRIVARSPAFFVLNCSSFASAEPSPSAKIYDCPNLELTISNQPGHCDCDTGHRTWVLYIATIVAGHAAVCSMEAIAALALAPDELVL
jgi:hypothetical protein